MVIYVMCSEVEEKLELLLEGQVSADEAQSLLDHLRTCKNCSILYEQLIEIRSLLMPENILPSARIQENLYKNIAVSSFYILLIAIMILITIGIFLFQIKTALLHPLPVGFKFFFISGNLILLITFLWLFKEVWQDFIYGITKLTKRGI